MSALVQFLPATLADFMARSPGTRVEVEEQLSGDIARAVQDGLADLGICAAGVPARPGPDAFSPRPAGGGGAGGPCAGRARVTDFRRCLAYDFVGLNRAARCWTPSRARRAARDAGLPLRRRIQVRSFDAMCEMIAAGLGIGVLPLGACERRLVGLDGLAAGGKLGRAPAADRRQRRTAPVGLGRASAAASARRRRRLRPLAERRLIACAPPRAASAEKFGRGARGAAS